MARKNLPGGLMGLPAATSAPVIDPERPCYAKGAIGAISRSVGDLQARALIEIGPHLIGAAGLHDRLESDPDEGATLRNSIAEYGQQVPVARTPGTPGATRSPRAGKTPPAVICPLSKRPVLPGRWWPQAMTENWSATSCR